MSIIPYIFMALIQMFILKFEPLCYVVGFLFIFNAVIGLYAVSI